MLITILLVLLTQVAVAVVTGITAVGLVLLADQALSSFAIQIHTLPQRPQLALQQLPLLVATAFINGQPLAPSRSKEIKWHTLLKSD